MSERRVVADGDVEMIAARLEARAERNEAEIAAGLERSEKRSREAGAFGLARDAVQSGQMPKLDDLPDVGMVMIDDPLELKHGRKAKPLRAKLVNLRDDPIGQMAKRGQIEAEQLQAARKWQALYDIAASIGGSRGIDPSAMKVDGGRFAEPVNDAQFGAIKELERLDVLLGCVGAALVRHVLGERMTLGQVAAMMGKTTARAVNNTGDRLRECLDTLVAIMGVEAKGKRSRAPRDDAAALARYTDNPLLYRAVHEARRKIV